MYMGDTNTEVLSPLKSGAKILTGTKTVITNQARNPVQNIKRIIDNTLSQLSIDTDIYNENNIVNDKKDEEQTISINKDTIAQNAQFIIKESMYKPPELMGGVTMVRNVANPYNPKIKSKSIVDQKDRFKTKNDVFPKVKVDNSIMDKRVRKVRTYLYKVDGRPVASKIENMPHQPYNPV